MRGGRICPSEKGRGTRPLQDPVQRPPRGPHWTRVGGLAAPQASRTRSRGRHPNSSPDPRARRPPRPSTGGEERQRGGRQHPQASAIRGVPRRREAPLPPPQQWHARSAGRPLPRRACAGSQPPPGPAHAPAEPPPPNRACSAAPEKSEEARPEASAAPPAARPAGRGSRASRRRVAPTERTGGAGRRRERRPSRTGGCSARPPQAGRQLPVSSCSPAQAATHLLAGHFGLRVAELGRSEPVHAETAAAVRAPLRIRRCQGGHAPPATATPLPGPPNERRAGRGGALLGGRCCKSRPLPGGTLEAAPRRIAWAGTK